jgi:hypothetical protein
MEPTMFGPSATEVLTPLILRTLVWAQLGVAIALIGVLAGIIAASREGRTGR